MANEDRSDNLKEQFSVNSGKSERDDALFKEHQDLEERLVHHEERSHKEKKRRKRKRNEDSSVQQALKLSSEFLAGIVIGIILGFGFDSFFGTRPFGLIFFLILGFCAGIVNVLRITGKMSSSAFDKMKNAHINKDDKTINDKKQ